MLSELSLSWPGFIAARRTSFNVRMEPSPSRFMPSIVVSCLPALIVPPRVIYRTISSETKSILKTVVHVGEPPTLASPGGWRANPQFVSEGRLAKASLLQPLPDLDQMWHILPIARPASGIPAVMFCSGAHRSRWQASRTTAQIFSTSCRIVRRAS